jgi:hypothetical protein
MRQASYSSAAWELGEGRCNFKIRKGSIKVRWNYRKEKTIQISAHFEYH